MRAQRFYLSVVALFVVAACAGQSPVAPTQQQLTTTIASASDYTTAVVAGKPTSTCPPGFNLGAVTFEEYLQLPRTQAALNDGIIDEPTLLAGLSSFDRNGNRILCVQRNTGLDQTARPLGGYLYNVIDDNVSAQK
jgi:hypothetical protein